MDKKDRLIELIHRKIKKVDFINSHKGNKQYFTRNRLLTFPLVFTLQGKRILLSSIQSKYPRSALYARNPELNLN